MLQDHGWTNHGSALWTSYRITRGLLRSGIATIPASIKRLLPAGHYALVGNDHGDIGQLVVRDGSMRGLLRFFRRRGAQVGDHLRVTLHLASRTAELELSREPFQSGDSSQKEQTGTCMIDDAVIRVDREPHNRNKKGGRWIWRSVAQG